MSFSLRRRLFGLWLVLPAGVFSGALVAYPVARMVWMSLHNYNLLRPAHVNDFVGLSHYRELLADHNFWHACLVMLVYSVAATALAYAIGLWAALLLSRRSRLVQVARTLLTLPWAVPGVIGGFVFLWMFDSSYGVANFLLTRLGLTRAPIDWLVHPLTAMVVIVLSVVWKTVPFNMLTHVAGLQSVPAELYEACRVDGAGGLQQFRYITWPALGPVRGITILLTLLHAFREFGEIYVVSGGGPARATETLAVQIYVEAFQYFHFGYAAAIGIVMLAISLLFTVLTLRMSRTAFF